MMLDSTNPEIMIENKKHELLERDMGRDEGDNFIFLKSILRDIMSVPKWWKRCLQLKFEFVINEVEEAERQLAYVSCISDI
jgi:hypothetical protein